MRELETCRFTSALAERKAKANFLRAYGDGLPESVIRKASRDKQWLAYCPKGEPNHIVAGMRYEHSDWYLCTLKNAAVAPEYRGRGLGSKMYAEMAERALKDPRCHVLAGDVTSTNEPSIRAIKKAGFRTVNRFCWGEGEEPADILHFVRLPPQDDRC